MPLPLWRPAYIALGSNLHEPPAQIQAAFDLLARIPDTRLLARSRTYRSRPLGPQGQPDFLNAAAGVLTQMAARPLLEALLAIERRMGRERGERWGPRIIDLDLVWMAGPGIEEPGLRLPHPGVSERNFVLYPLADIAPDLRISALGLVRELKSRIGGAGITPIDSVHPSP